MCAFGIIRSEETRKGLQGRRRTFKQWEIEYSVLKGQRKIGIEMIRGK